MAQRYLRSEINRGATQARVYIGENVLPRAEVTRRDGHWHARCYLTGKALLPNVPHDKTPLGVFLKELRPVLLGA